MDKIEVGIFNFLGTVSVVKFVKLNLIKNVRFIFFKKKCMSLYNLKLYVFFLDFKLIVLK